MRILIIRHGDPYYPTDSLTEKGQREADLLGKRLIHEHITHAYVSPLGRAKKTAEPFLSAAGMQATELEWLREFPADLAEEYTTTLEPITACPWNMPPKMWVNQPGIFDCEKWRDAPIYQNTKIPETYDFVCRGWDALMAEHGYTRDGAVYRVGEGWEEKKETIALFCHLGLGNVLLSHVLHMSPTAVWHTLFLPTSSVTTVFMERHLTDPIAHARIVGMGDTSHLYAGGEPVSASGLHSDEIR